MAFFVAFEFPWHHSDGPCFTERHGLCVLLRCGWAQIFHRFHNHHFYSYGLNPQQAQINLAPCWAKLMPAEDLPYKLCVYITHACTHRGCPVFKVYTRLLICTVHLIHHVWSRSEARAHRCGEQEGIPAGRTRLCCVCQTAVSGWGWLAPRGIGGTNQQGRQNVLVCASGMSKIRVGKWLPFCRFWRLFPMLGICCRHSWYKVQSTLKLKSVLLWAIQLDQ